MSNPTGCKNWREYAQELEQAVATMKEREREAFRIGARWAAGSFPTIIITDAAIDKMLKEAREAGLAP